MKHNPAIHRRRSIRLQGYDYSRAGAYFITICAQNRECMFGEIENGGILLNDGGRMVQTVWDGLPIRFRHIELDEFAIMPNHIHGIIVLTRRGEPCVRPNPSDDHTMGEHKVRPYGTLPDTVGRIVQAFKSITTHEYTNGAKKNGWLPFPGKLWQRNYWEHVVRDERELNLIREYIHNNPAQWESDKLYIGKDDLRTAPAGNAGSGKTKLSKP